MGGNRIRYLLTSKPRYAAQRDDVTVKSMLCRLKFYVLMSCVIFGEEKKLNYSFEYFPLPIVKIMTETKN